MDCSNLHYEPASLYGYLKSGVWGVGHTGIK
jgi:hypothetical protein